MPIGRLFFEISGDSSKLNQELQKAIATAKDAGVQITRAGQSFISKFDEALNPTKKPVVQTPSNFPRSTGRLFRLAGRSSSRNSVEKGDLCQFPIFSAFNLPQTIVKSLLENQE